MKIFNGLALLTLTVVSSSTAYKQHEFLTDNNVSNNVVFKCEFQSLNDLKEIMDNDLFDVWHVAGMAVDVRPLNAQSFAILQSKHYCKVWIKDLQYLIHQESSIRNSSKVLSLPDQDEYFEDYHSIDEIYQFCEFMVDKYPNLISKYLPSIAKTHEGRRIPVLHLTSPVNSAEKKKIWFNGGIHAREWISSHVAMYLMKQLLSGYGTDEQATMLLDKFEFIVAPHINPDGYEYSRTANRMWRKNRRRNGQQSFGVDLNRNFDVDWAQGGSSRSPNSETYHGPHAASEPEVRGLQQYISAQNGIVVGIDLHAYGQLIMRPYGNKMSDHPNEAFNKHLGDSMAAVIKEYSGTVYTSQKSAGLYPVSGGFDDWITEKYKAVGFTIELRDRGRFGFILPREQILPTAKEIWQGFVVFCQQLY